ncbi:MAG: UDP-N-acetylmuramoyl-L-alanyl-D-glutamate--2,6-diaminopimelate ligase [Flavisolibacter sp.]|jgi:UDP-N-acetylmuramoyl-L-alanyl-D-glutamate--2,6-diaminopimelate ligase|nr:UDP-N-acetylmuramoyl-L-alanyl-D-glutamate--2,6-diaminopimelate ligase [Flavisolibacter sp.]
MIKLSDILYTVQTKGLSGITDMDIADVQIDSREVKKGALFIALKGAAVDGHQFIQKAIEKGAIAIVCETIPSEKQEGITYVQVVDSNEAAGRIAHNFYGQPSKQLKLIGITGTNGKTTIATLLFKLFTCLGYKCGLISTVENMIGEQIIPSTHTTPDAVSLNHLVRKMADEGCAFAFMEVSSHAVHQKRIAGLEFAGGVFSNITHDHLDYHKTFEAYIKAKKGFFDGLSSHAFALTNIDDKRGLVMLQNTNARKQSYSLKSAADYKGKILENLLTGLVMIVNEQEVHFRLIGEFNAYNLLAVYGTALLLEEDKSQVLQCLSNITGAEGRFDYIVSQKERIIGIVDYAHTPDALENVLTTIKKLKKGFEQVITVVGCGGDRDKTKRPIMGEVACANSDRVIFTSDNPRSEDPQQILSDMENGLSVSAKRKFISIADRLQAIKTAVSMAKPEDIVLVAGKGHEKYQEINSVKHHFDDKEVLMELFKQLDK